MAIREIRVGGPVVQEHDPEVVEPIVPATLKLPTNHEIILEEVLEVIEE